MLKKDYQAFWKTCASLKLLLQTLWQPAGAKTAIFVPTYRPTDILYMPTDTFALLNWNSFIKILLIITQVLPHMLYNSKHALNVVCLYCETILESVVCSIKNKKLAFWYILPRWLDVSLKHCNHKIYFGLWA